MGQRVKKRLERDIQREICEFLNVQGLFFWRNNNTPIYGRSNDGQMRFRAMPKFAIKGVPDIIVIRNGHFIGLEVKQPNTDLKDAQLAFREACERNGGKYHIVHSVEDAARALGLSLA